MDQDNHTPTLSRAQRAALTALAFEPLDAALTLPVPPTPTYRYAQHVLRIWDATARALYRAHAAGLIDEAALSRAWAERRVFLERHRSTLLRGLSLGSAA